MGIWVDLCVCLEHSHACTSTLLAWKHKGRERERRTIRGFLGTSRFSCGREGGRRTNAKEQSLLHGVGDIAKEKEQSTYRKEHNPAT